MEVRYARTFKPPFALSEVEGQPLRLGFDFAQPERAFAD
jgi:hypothetical protein